MAVHYRSFPEVSQQLKDFFWSKVAIAGVDECWIWQGGSNPKRGNYGRFYIKREDYRAHRVAYYFHYGVDPGELDVCHKCDNPPCVNPHHLFAGTHQENHDDMHRKGRHVSGIKGRPELAARGNDRPQSKMTAEKVIEARLRYAEGGISQTKLGAIYGICHASMWRILMRRSWTHV